MEALSNNTGFNGLKAGLNGSPAFTALLVGYLPTIALAILMSFLPVILTREAPLQARPRWHVPLLSVLLCAHRIRAD